MKRVVLIVFGVIVLLVAAPLLIGGLVSAVLGAGDDPTVDGRLGGVESSGYAVVSDTLDVHWDFPFADRFDIELGVRSANPEATVFIGYGSAASVDAYLSGVPHTLVYDIGGEARSDGEVEVPGSTAPEPPGDQDFWVVRASGLDLQAIPLASGAGSYRLVVMNADGSQGVDVSFYGSITLPYLLPVGIGMLIVGSLLLVFAIALLVWAIRSKPQPTAAPVGEGYGPAAYPVPPAPYKSPEPSPSTGPYPSPGQDPGAVPGGPDQPAGPPTAPPVQGASGQPGSAPQPPAQPGNAPPQAGNTGDPSA